MNEHQPDEHDISRLRQELEEAHKTMRGLVRQLAKEQVRHHESARAYNKTVSNLMEMARENTTLAAERDALRDQAMTPRQVPLTWQLPLPQLTEDEMLAIRRAIVRLYSTDDTSAERLRLWTGIFEALEHAEQGR